MSRVCEGKWEEYNSVENHVKCMCEHSAHSLTSVILCVFIFNACYEMPPKFQEMLSLHCPAARILDTRSLVALENHESLS